MLLLPANLSGLPPVCNCSFHPILPSNVSVPLDMPRKRIDLETDDLNVRPRKVHCCLMTAQAFTHTGRRDKKKTEVSEEWRRVVVEKNECVVHRMHM